MSTRASATRYARALFDVALKEADPVSAERDLAAFVDVVQAHADLQRTLANPVVSASTKRAIVQQITERMRPSSPVGKLLLLLASRGRLDLVADVLAVYRERLMEHQRVVEAEVTTATPLGHEDVARIQERLVRLTGRAVTMTTRVDSGLIGGVVTRIGSTVYDGSVAAQLARVRDRLSERRRG
jgi:F-type H+-transporting ATPase subunit delta